jgi:hypothetical protein
MGYMDKAAPGKNRYAGAHGGGVRGDQTSIFEGRFGRMFPDLPRSSFETEKLTLLGQAMTADPERVSDDPKDPGYNLPAATPENEKDGEENSGISAGYTYLGQFIDHDITFDPVSSLQGRNDPDALRDFRTPALDLDCLYGRGPADQPYMFEPDGKSFRLGRELTQGFGGPVTARDLPRFGGNPPDDDRPARALIGDKRNDENVIVSQLQGAFLRFHNRVVRENRLLSFEEVQQIVRWHYQWVVLYDFLPTIVGEATLKKIWPAWTPRGSGGALAKLQYYRPRDGVPYIPIEFSAAAYRFGHSMVRPIYRLNINLSGGKDPRHSSPAEVNEQHIDGRFFIFAGVQERGLNGFDAFPSQWAIDWSLFFDIANSGLETGKSRVQPAYKIDTSLVNPLGFLPEFSGPLFVPGSDLNVRTLQAHALDPDKNPSNLAVRNLWRGNSMGLPSGQVVAAALGEAPLKADELVVGKAQMNDQGRPDDKSIRDVADGRFANESPLWYYVLAEANAQWRRASAGKSVEQANAVPVRLGPVGGRIVAETIVGLVLADKNSFLSLDPGWTPTLPAAKGAFGIADLIAYAMEL